MGEMIICVAPEGEGFVHAKIGEGGETLPLGVKGYIDFDPGKCIEVTLGPGGRETIKMPGNPEDAESARLALEQGMGYVLSQFAGSPVEVTFGTEQGMVAKADIQIFLRGEDCFVNLGTPTTDLEEAEQNGAVERCKITTKMAYIESVK